LNIDLSESLGTWLEYRGQVAIEGGAAYEASFVTGLSFAIGPNLVLDAGVQAGLNDAAPVVSATTGITLRF
jgi:hypothetical protein